MLMESIGVVEIAQGKAARSIGAIEAHAVVGLRAYAKGLGVIARRLAHDCAFAGDDPCCGYARMEGSGRVLNVVLRSADCRIGAIETAVAGDSIFPGLFVHRELYRLSKQDDGILFAEIVSLWRRLHLLEFCLLLRISREGRLVRLVSARPQRRSHCNRIVID